MLRNADVEKTQAPMDERDFRLMQEREKRLADCGNAVSTARPMSSEEIVAEFFKYHAPNESTIPKHAAVNQAAKNFAEVILQNVPAGTDRIAAINYIRLARMLANGGISLNGLSLD